MLSCRLSNWEYSLAAGQKIRETDHLKQVLNSCWDSIRQEQTNAAFDQWPKWLLMVVRSLAGCACWLRIFSVNSAMCTCCKLYFGQWVAFKLLPLLMFLLAHLPGTAFRLCMSSAASIPIYRWRQMRHGQFLGGSIKSLILSFNIQKCEFCAQI